MNYKRLLVSLLVAGASLTSSLANAYTDLQQPHDYDQVAKELTEMLEAVHYNRPTIDDRISASAFDLYLDSLDPTKSFFLKSDIDKLSKHRLELDDALRDGKTQIAYDIYNLYMHRVEDRLNKLVKELPDMVSNFDYTKEENLNVDFDTIQWSETPQVLDEYWRKRIKNRALTLKLNDEPVDKIASVIEKRYRNQLKQIEQTEPADVFQTFANSITAALDPHTTYFAPRASETFNINMSLSLEGIGAVLQYDDDYTKVVRLIPGGPAEKQNELAPNDRILAVGQDNKEMVDVVGMRLDDVVDMIRGERGTKVYLEIQPAKGDGQTTKTINITREKVKLEDQAAKKKIINVERGGETYKVGVIELPTFYSDFAAIQAGDRDYKSSTRDTKKLIEELRQEGVIAIVLDLRNNGGGSLQEANSLAGLFIPRGPILQFKDTSGRVRVMEDRDPSVTYSGPLGVLVNRMSASASEIVAAALQDYGRALILGGQTFGKGTVQVLQEMDKGQLKVTQAKFYRVSGESTQHKGVHPDIAFPSLLDEKSVGESAQKNPLSWDKIHETRYPVYWEMSDYLPVLEPRHEQRMKEEPNFVALVDQINDVREQASTFKSISLNEEARLQLREEGKEKSIARENKRRKALGLDPITKEDEIEPSEDDPYAQEAAEVMLDFIAANQLK
ncbi:tail-specific protease [Marinomonas mediterranea]|uniref:carboxy terminal-processing peptidase n=1 Tax=Marinomonas mediterranea TaxID=119864 RepID=UPI002349E533|nr:carboxy terminal-processing peptidase [Marinomonas mediterranea]WCN14234.1 tail-specific protease [Marinomonas mediterranea]